MPRVSWLLIVVLIMAGATLLSKSGRAQPVAEDPSVLRQQIRDGIRLLRDGDPRTACQQLRPLWRENLAIYVDGVGSLAYWVGRCFAEAKNEKKARLTWQSGMTALDRNDVFDPRLQDAYARHIATEDIRAFYSFYSSATDAYVELFERASAVLDSVGRAVIHRHVTQMAPLLPDSLQQKFLRKSSPGGYVTYRLRAGRGPDVAAWWRAQDPAPGTPRNERILEHLRRVQHAEAAYSCERCPAGYDDRGKVYVQLGPPEYTKEVNYPEPPIAGSYNPPDHEIWFYPEYGAAAIYPLVKRQGRYRLSGTQALIPKSFRLGFSKTRRGKTKTAIALNTMRRVYRELWSNSEYARIYEDVRHWGNSDVRPQTLARSYLRQIQVSDTRTATRRQKEVPTQQTAVHENLRTIRTVARPVRFLNSEGQTRTLVTWSHEPNTLPSRAVVTAHAVRYDSTYRVHQRRQRTYTLVPGTTETSGAIRALSMEEIEGTHHLRLQWNAYPQGAFSSDVDSARLERTHTSVVRFDTLEALPGHSSRLLLSDLLPGRLHSASRDTGESDTVRVGPAGMAFTPYPFSRLRPNQPLALYFEVYNLAYGPDDRTQYTIRYELEQKKEGGLFRLFRDETRQTGTTTEVKGASRRSDEIIELDLSEALGADQVRITVRVTDDVAGQTVERSLTFEVVE